MPDFTLKTYYRLLTTLKGQEYTFQTFAGYLKDPAPRVIILRHDVDARKMNSLQTARMEKEIGITGTYYFRMVPGSFDEDVIEQIYKLGHEIGYHYEDVSMSAALRRASCVVNRIKRRKTQDSRLTEEELPGAAIASFRENLEKLRRVVPVETICMHGSPLSKYDNRMLWEKYNYRDYGIIGEPYIDVDFNEVLYLTDTGRRWDGDSVSLRDKAVGGRRKAEGEDKRYELWGMGYEENQYLKKENPATSSQQPATLPKFRSTSDIIKAAKENKLPDRIMLTIHPQRWDDRPLPWTKELIWQNTKNVGKIILKARRRE